MTRAQVSALTFRRLWKREHLTDEFLAEVREWLLTFEWALFYTGEIFGVVKTEAVSNWPTLASKSIAKDLADLGEGNFKFGELEQSLFGVDVGEQESSSDISKQDEASEK